MNFKSLSIVAALIAASFGASAAQADEYALNQNYQTTVYSSSARLTERVAAVDEFQRNQLPTVNGVSTVERAQVAAEAKEARKLGLISEGERLAQPTAAQAARIQQAGLNAVQHQVAAR